MLKAANESPPENKNNTVKLNKIVSALTLTVAAVAVFTSTNASAAEPLLSPRAKANVIVRIGGSEADHLDRGLPTASPKARELAKSLARIGGSEADHLDRDVSSVNPKLAVTFPDVAAHVRMLRGSK